MVLGKYGVSIVLQQSWVDFGVEENAYEIRWLADNGWATFRAELPTLYTVVSEVGGRCELRARPDQPADGEYFGSDALTFVSAGSTVVVHAAEMRQVRCCCFAFRPSDAEYLSGEQAAAIAYAPSRYMFHNAHQGSTCRPNRTGGQCQNNKRTAGAQQCRAGADRRSYLRASWPSACDTRRSTSDAWPCGSNRHVDDSLMFSAQVIAGDVPSAQGP